MATNSNAINIHELFLESCIFQMPLFQREYQWDDTNQLKKFWSDLISVLDEEIEVSFLGAIVLQAEKPGDAKTSKVYTVIDGQQRITTFFILLLAIIKYSFDRGWHDTAKDIESQYLISSLSGEKGKAKVVPTFRDNSNFNEIVKRISKTRIKALQETGTTDGAMVQAFEFFLSNVSNYIESDESSNDAEQIGRIHDALLQKMEIVQIVLDKTHNANEVFDRLNTAGRPLTAMDLIRNEIFQTVSDDYSKAEDLYHKHWQPFERGFEKELEDQHDATSRNKIIEGFFFPYALTQKSTAKKNHLLSDLRAVWTDISDTGQIDPVKAISSMESMKGPYLAIDQGIKISGVPEELWEIIIGLRRIPIPGVAHPYFMKMLESISGKNSDANDAIRVSKILESFFVRRGITGLEPTGLHAVFKRLWDTAGLDAQKVFKSIQTGTISFPTDEELVTAILTKPLYKKRVEKYVLASYEIYLQKSSISQLRYLPEITTDHILPQGLGGEWKEIITQEEHGEIVHLWGNLVPLSTPENSAKNAKSFSEAREILENETSFKSTKEVLKNFKSWNGGAVEKRGKALAKWAVTRWPRDTA